MYHQPYVSADALLQKASLQLSGQWPSSKQDDLQDYLNSMNRKANVNNVKFKDIASDISMSSDDVEIDFAKSSSDDNDEEADYFDPKGWRENQFFKQPPPFDMFPPNSVPTSPFVIPSASSHPLKESPLASVLKPASKTGLSVPLPGGRSLPQTSTALDRASALVQKIERRVMGLEQHPKSGMRISFDIDSDEDLKDGFNDKENSNDTHSAKNILKNGQRFLKKPPAEKLAVNKSGIVHSSEKPKPKKTQEKEKSLIHSTNIVLSSDDESMAEFIERLSLPDTPLVVHKDPASMLMDRLSRNSSKERKSSILKRSPSPILKKSPSPRQIYSPSQRNQSSRSPSPAFAARTMKHLYSVTEDLTIAESIPVEIVEESVEEEKDENKKTSVSKSTENDLKLNLLDVEDLKSPFQGSPEQVSTEKKEKLSSKYLHNSKTSRQSSRKSSRHSSQKSSRHSSRHSSRPSSRDNSDQSIIEDIHSKEHKLFSTFGIQTIEDLLPQAQLAPGYLRTVSFDTGSLKVISSCHEESITELMSEIHTQRSVTPSMMKKHSSHSSSAAVDVYSNDYHFANVSDSYQNATYTEDFHTVGTATSTSSDTFLTTSNTDMNTYGGSKEKTTEDRRSERRKKKKSKSPKVIRVCNEGTQTNELEFIQSKLEASPWNSLYAAQDWKGRPLVAGTPKPVISSTPQICGRHACVNAHIPSQPNLIAVHEILKQQLEFTRQFCESQKYLYHSLVEAIVPDYVYTTLEDTKEYIKKHRKPKLTLKKALEMVELEM